MLQGLESPCFLAFLPLGLIIKKENESFMNKWVQTEKIIK